MLAELRRAALKRKRAFAHHDGAANARRSFRIDPHAARNELPIGEEVGDRIDRPGGNDRLLEGGDEVVASPAAGLRREFARQIGSVRNARGVGPKALVGGQRIEAEGRAQTPKLRIVANRHDHIAVGDRKGLIGGDVRVRVAHAARRDARGQIVHRLVGEHRAHRVEEGEVDLLSAPAALALDQRRFDCDHAVEPGEEVADRDADLLRLAVRVAGDVHVAGHALDEEIVSRALGVGAGLAEAGDRTIDEARIEALQAPVVEAKLRKAADLEILDQHVRARREAPHDLAPALGREVGDDRALAAVAAVKIRGRPLAAGLDERRAPAAGVIAFRALDLDDVGAEVRQRLPDPGTGENARELDDADPGERAHAD